MKINPMGAAGEVTRSVYLAEESRGALAAVIGERYGVTPILPAESQVLEL